MKILVTGAAGFIGFHLSRRLISEGREVVGIDNLNDYYDVNLKEARLAQLAELPGYSHHRIDIADAEAMRRVLAAEKPERIVHLAAQAGVRYSLENPYAYIDANINGFLNVLEGVRNIGTEHLVFASTSSVYGNHTNMPFSV
ncbi:MAG: GDP-mannose 4,6-dehydratase, partial [Pseudomonadales bacterium]